MTKHSIQEQQKGRLAMKIKRNRSKELMNYKSIAARKIMGNPDL